LKKPSVVNSGSKPPSFFTFFLDRSLGRRKVANVLRGAGATVEIHDDHFSPDTRDEDWLQEVGRRGWIVLTKDSRIRYHTSERLALIKAGVAAFVLSGGNLRGDEMAEIFVKALPAMCRFARKNCPPFIARITKGGSVTRLYP